MTKPFDALYNDLEKALNLEGRHHQGPDRYVRGIELIRERIGKLRQQGISFIKGEAKEIEYFRGVWPAFYGKLLFYIRLHSLELQRATMPADDWLSVIGKQERGVAAFFRTNREFWQYYASGASILNEQFTRAYSRGRILDPLALLLDQEAVTIASYRAACCLAMQEFGVWLREERATLSVGTISAADLGYSWGPSDADLAEWLFGLQVVGAIRYQGEPADISRLQKWSRLALGKDVANIYDRFKVLRNRKKERLAFTKKIAGALERRMDQAEGKFD